MMKLLNNTNLFATLVSNEQESSELNTNGYSKEFQSMLDSLHEEDCDEESTVTINGKRRRLSLEKVKKLEKHFEADNKLEPSRKGKIAEELGLQGRQVAIWFQNRRARLKSKQLEKEYEVLKSEYEVLKLNFDVLENEKLALKAEIEELKRKLESKNDEEIQFSQSGNNVSNQSRKISPDGIGSEFIPNNATSDLFDNGNELRKVVEFKNSLSDSGSSEALNIAPMLNWFQASNAMNQNQFGKLEEHCFDNDETGDCYELFFVDQTPIFQWYNLD